MTDHTARRRTLPRTVAAGLPSAALAGLIAALVPPLCGGCAAATLGPVATAPPAAPATACMPFRWIARKTNPNAPCPPPPPPWTGRPLFGSPAAPPGSLPPGLRPFCLYEHPDVGSPTFPTVLLAAGISDAAMDCAVVGAQATPVAAVVEPLLAERFAAQAGAVTLPATGAPPRLAVIDSAPTGGGPVEGIDANSPHGVTLLHLARRLLCSSSDCLAQLTARLALPIVRFDPTDARRVTEDLVSGGYVGTQGDLAEAVAAEVEDWYQAATEPHLVLNLSVAWDGERFGGAESAPEQMGPTVAAVYRALEHAACRGALVIAAAGNRSGGPELATDPLYPAAWETRPAPAAEHCGEPPGEGPVRIHKNAAASGYRPLLFASGGVDGDGRPLPNARALPRLVAFADHAVVPAPGALRPPATLTGSSVATLLTSATAAALWHYRPELSGSEVMGKLYAAAIGQGEPADFHLPQGGPPPQRRRVVLCRAVAAACQGGGPPCPPVVPPCPSLGGGALVLPPEDQEQLLALPGAVAVDGAVLTAQGQLPAPCEAQSLVFDPVGGPPADLCPFSQYPALAANAWTSPQPGSNPCPNCQIFPTLGIVLMEIDPEFKGAVTSPVLHLGEESYALPVASLDPGQVVKVEDLPLPESLGPGPAPYLSFTVDGAWSAQSTLLVVE